MFLASKNDISMFRVGDSFPLFTMMEDVSTFPADEDLSKFSASDDVEFPESPSRRNSYRRSFGDLSTGAPMFSEEGGKGLATRVF